MSDERFVLLGLARPRVAWFSEVSRWATSGIVPAEFVKCVSAEELRARLRSGRPWSAVLLDGSITAVDRDLLAAVGDAGSVAVVVDDRQDSARWRALGATAVLTPLFDRDTLLEVLDACAKGVGRPTGLPAAARDLPVSSRSEGLLVCVCGPGGTGASTAAAALAQGMAAGGRETVLADLARNAEQAVLHDVRDVVPSIQELVEAHRNGVPTIDDVRGLTFDVVERGYSLLLGLRRARYWPTLRPRAFASSLESLRHSFEVVVCDVTADLESESDAGSSDVEDRNLAARTAALDADVVVVVGRPGVKGVHALVRVLTDLSSAGVAAARILPVITCAPRSPRARAELASAVAALARPALGGGTTPSPLFLPTRPVEAAFRDGTALPGPLPARVLAGVLAVLERVGPSTRRIVEPVAVVPGSLGAFTDETSQ